MKRSADAEEFLESEEDSSDEEYLTTRYIIRKNYEVIFKELVSGESANVTEVSGYIKKGKSTIGSLQAYLIDRENAKSHFYEDCDTVNQETMDVALAFTNSHGGLLYDKIEGLEREDARHSEGGFLVVEQIELKEKYRGKDIGLDVLDTLLDHLEDRWTIAWVDPGPTSGSLKSKLNQGSVDNICIKLARHFARLGFRQASRTAGQNSCYWYLIPEHRVREDKDRFADLEVYIEPVPNQTSHTPLIKLILESGEHLTKADQDTVTALVKKGSDIDDVQGLHYAVANDKLAIVPLLLELGGNIDHQNACGDTPLHVAANMYREDVTACQILVDAGAKTDITNSRGSTPYHSAVVAADDDFKFRATFGLPSPRRQQWARLKDLYNVLSSPSRS